METESLNDRPGYVFPLMYEYAGKKYLVNVSSVFWKHLKNGRMALDISHIRFILNNWRMGRNTTFSG